jgi:translation initiation factor 3 subunit K
MAYRYPTRYQFNVDLYNADVVINILIKALTATPLPDFNLCVALLSEQHSTPNQNQDEPDHLPQLLPILTELSRYLNECRFPAFWALYNDDQPQLALLRENFTVEVVGFEDAIREVVVRAVKQTFTKIGRPRLESYLNLTGEPPSEKIYNIFTTGPSL